MLVPLGRQQAVAASDRHRGAGGAAGDRELHDNLLWIAAARAWWASPVPGDTALIATPRRLGDATPRIRGVFAIHAYADPWGNAAGVLERLTGAARTRGLDTDAARFFGPAALVVGAFDLGSRLPRRCGRRRCGRRDGSGICRAC